MTVQSVMKRKNLVRLALILAFSLLALGSAGFAQTPPASGTTPFIFDGNRVYAELSFVRPDRSTHRALAFVDMGSPDMVLASSLYRELHLDNNHPLLFHVGNLAISLPADNITSDPDPPYSVGSDLKVEAVLPAGVLQHYQVVIDYQRRTLTMALPGTITPTGRMVPFQINPQTGLIAVQAMIDAHTYAVTIDNGSAYTWFRQATVRSWLADHPEWERGVGAVGASNMMMSGEATETKGILLRIPEISVGQLTLKLGTGHLFVKQVGVLGAGLGEGPNHQDLFDWYSTKNAVPVIGWIGGNVLKAYRLTIDYPNHQMYWLPQVPPDTADLNQVGLSLKTSAGEFVVATVATKNGKPTVEGVQPGDKLLSIDHLDTTGATWGSIYDSLHGTPGEPRTLQLERNGRKFTVRTIVTAF